MENKKTVFITGITGQCASYLAELLLKKDYKVVGMKRRSSTNNLWRIQSILDNPNFIIEEGDVTDFSSLWILLNKYKLDVLYNTAAMSHVAVSFDQPGLSLDVTAKGVLNLLEVIRQLKLPTKFVQFSSSEMYGDNYDVKDILNDAGSFQHDDSNCYQDENTEFSPNSPYAIAKLAAHHLVRIYRDSYGVNASTVILHNSESPKRGENFVTRKITKWLAKFEHAIGSYSCFTSDNDFIYYGIKIEQFPKLKLGNIYAKRDWGYVKDRMRGVILVGEHNEPDDYCIGSGEAHSVEDFLVEAFNHIGILDYRPFIKIDKSLYRLNEVPYLCGNFKKIERKLGWRPEVSFKQLVKIMMTAELESYIAKK